jgi:hypothetical protein
MSSMRNTSLLAVGIILITGVFFARQSVALLGKSDASKPCARTFKKLAEPKFRPINPPVDVMVNPLIKSVREGDLCVNE